MGATGICENYHPYIENAFPLFGNAFISYRYREIDAQKRAYA